jgi:hypothetical protein
LAHEQKRAVGSEEAREAGLRIRSRRDEKLRRDEDGGTEERRISKPDQQRNDTENKNEKKKEKTTRARTGTGRGRTRSWELGCRGCFAG